jgi:2-keto-4-pentenoate hydratase
MRDCLAANSVVPASCFVANPAIEGEMALRIGVDGEIAAAFPVIELHQFVFRAPRKTLAELVANNGMNAGAVIPQDLEAASLED